MSPTRPARNASRSETGEGTKGVARHKTRDKTYIPLIENWTFKANNAILISVSDGNFAADKKGGLMGWFGGNNMSYNEISQPELPEARFYVQLLGQEGFSDQEWDDVLSFSADHESNMRVLTRTNGRKVFISMNGTGTLLIEERD